MGIAFFLSDYMAALKVGDRPIWHHASLPGMHKGLLHYARHTHI